MSKEDLRVMPWNITVDEYQKRNIALIQKGEKKRIVEIIDKLYKEQPNAILDELVHRINASQNTGKVSK